MLKFIDTLTNKLPILIFFLFIIQASNFLKAKSQSKSCVIKYGEPAGEYSLEKKYLEEIKFSRVIPKHGVDCYQIGVEHDKNKKPINDKPIYACCHNI